MRYPTLPIAMVQARTLAYQNRGTKVAIYVQEDGGFVLALEHQPQPEGLFVTDVRVSKTGVGNPAPPREPGPGEG